MLWFYTFIVSGFKGFIILQLHFYSLTARLRPLWIWIQNTSFPANLARWACRVSRGGLLAFVVLFHLPTFALSGHGFKRVSHFYISFAFFHFYISNFTLPPLYFHTFIHLNCWTFTLLYFARLHFYTFTVLQLYSFWRCSFIVSHFAFNNVIILYFCFCSSKV